WSSSQTGSCAHDPNQIKETPSPGSGGTPREARLGGGVRKPDQKACREPRPPRLESRLRLREAWRSSLSRRKRFSLDSKDLFPRPPPKRRGRSLVTRRMERPILPSLTLITRTLMTSFILTNWWISSTY